MNREELREYRRRHVPVFNDQKLKLGIFALNCSGGNVITTLPKGDQMTWDYNLKVIQLADSVGMEIALPLGRFKGQGGPSNHNGSTFEVYTWAAAMAALTKNITCFATSQVALNHPVIAAKQAVTIDHISKGRFGLNVLMGWFADEMKMFGVDLREHDDRYRLGDEWITVVKKLWTDPPGGDFKGRYFDLQGLEAEPRPVQKPGPVLINAGTSPAGMEFTAKHIDISFGSVSKPEDIDRLLSVSRIADEKYGRDVGLMCSALIICRDTEAEAQAAYARILDNGDWEAARNMLSVLGVQSQSFQHGFEDRVKRFCAGYGTNPLIGTPEQIVDQLQDYSRRGLHGVVLYFEDYHAELQHFCDRVLPLMKQAGLRH